MLTTLLLLTLGGPVEPPAYNEPPGYREPPAANMKAEVIDTRDPSKEVVVSVDADGWHAKYKGRVKAWPRSTSPADVARLAGEWGQGIDTPKVAPEVRPATTFRPLQPVQQLQPRLPPERVKPADTVPLVSGEVSHMCPKCGAGEWRTVESFNANGTHNHRCLNCNTVFTH